MKKNIAKILIIGLFLNIIISNTYGEEISSSYTTNNLWSLYEERVEKICNPYLYKNNDIKNERINLFIDINDNYPEIVSKENIKGKENNPKYTTSYDLPTIKYTHKENMNNIYKCALLSIQDKSYKLIVDDLIKHSSEITKKLERNIKSIRNALEKSSNSLNCKNSTNKSGIEKVNLLHQVTYQTCKYINYLEYLREYNKYTKNLITSDHIDSEDKQGIAIGEIAVRAVERNRKIDEEINHTYKVFPIAYQAYSEYENNITIHLMLELIKNDYIILRQKLHEVINPINQVVYKISNAMKK